MTPWEGCLDPALRTGWAWAGVAGGGEAGAMPRAPTMPTPSCPALWPQEFEVIAQIKLLQSACNSYSIVPEEHFRAWFRAMERLSETERCICVGIGRTGRAVVWDRGQRWTDWASRRPLPGRFWEGNLGVPPRSLTAVPLSRSYNLSCELEPPSESASNTLKAKKNAAIVKRWSE